MTEPNQNDPALKFKAAQSAEMVEPSASNPGARLTANDQSANLPIAAVPMESPQMVPGEISSSHGATIPQGIRSRWGDANIAKPPAMNAGAKAKGNDGRKFFIVLLLIMAPILAVVSAVLSDARFSKVMQDPQQKGVLCRVVGHLIQPVVPAAAGWLYDTSYACDPTNATGLVDHAFLKQISGDEAGAKADYERLLKISPNARIYNNLGNIYEDENRVADAIAAYSKALELDPNWAFASYNRGNMYVAQKKFNEALADFNRSIHSRYATAYFRRAELYKSLGKSDLAARDLEIIRKNGYEDKMFGFMRDDPPADEQ